MMAASAAGGQGRRGRRPGSGSLSGFGQGFWPRSKLPFEGEDDRVGGGLEPIDSGDGSPRLMLIQAVGRACRSVSGTSSLSGVADPAR